MKKNYHDCIKFQFHFQGIFGTWKIFFRPQNLLLKHDKHLYLKQKRLYFIFIANHKAYLQSYYLEHFNSLNYCKWLTKLTLLHFVLLNRHYCYMIIFWILIYLSSLYTFVFAVRHFKKCIEWNFVKKNSQKLMVHHIKFTIYLTKFLYERNISIEPEPIVIHCIDDFYKVTFS